MTAKGLINRYKQDAWTRIWTMIIRILAGVEKSIEDTRESLYVEIKEIKSSQAKIKNAITECNLKWMPQRQGWMKQSSNQQCRR